MSTSVSTTPRVRLDGKSFRLNGQKFAVKGVTYGPFAPDKDGHHFGTPGQTAKDFDQIRSLGANLLRVYYIPPGWFLDLAQAKGLKVLIDIPWNKHICFLDAVETREEIFEMVRGAAQRCQGHPAVFALSVVNEIPADIVRWSGAEAVAEFIEELVSIVKGIDPDCLCTFGNYPPTEYLRPQNIDFYCFNVYLHHPKPFEGYLARLQMVADAKPIILGEFGMDTIREGEEAQASALAWQIESAFRGGLAGVIIYSFTDDWFKEGMQVTDWAFGLTDAARKPKRAFEVVREGFRIAPYFPLSRYPMVSVVVASYNGDRTLQICLESLQKLNYPAYEVILVDDGSTDTTAEIVSKFTSVRYIFHQTNEGLSVARNTGITAARGEIVAFTDSDCRADEDWLYYLVGDLIHSPFAGIGGHNFLPPEDSWMAACVMVSPGGPAHVMLTDRLAEHIPGCNMAFYKQALEDIGGFDPLFRTAGDDVDVCWRLQQHGLKIGFSPAGFVWHYRRSTVQAYLKQQQGYGAAEALLVHRHPEYFNWFGGSQWQGRIYSPAKFGVVTRGPMIYHGWFGSGFFQTLYTPYPSVTLTLLSSLEFHVLVTLPLLILGVVVRSLLPLGISTAAISVAVCMAAAFQADMPRDKKRFWSRPLVALLFFLQPITRGLARYQGSLRVPRSHLAQHESLESLSRSDGVSFDQVEYWNEKGIDRLTFLAQLVERLDQKGWQNKVDVGWKEYDVEIFGSAWTHLELTTVAEVLGHGKQLIRCRLRPAWTFLAKLIFWSSLGFELLIIGFIGQEIWWIWLVLLTLPGLASFMAKEQRDLQRLMATFLDEVALEHKLKKIDASGTNPGAK